jgi:hypothetical protein
VTLVHKEVKDKLVPLFNSLPGYEEVWGSVDVLLISPPDECDRPASRPGCPTSRYSLDRELDDSRGGLDAVQKRKISASTRNRNPIQSLVTILTELPKWRQDESWSAPVGANTGNWACGVSLGQMSQLASDYVDLKSLTVFDNYVEVTGTSLTRPKIIRIEVPMQMRNTNGYESIRADFFGIFLAISWRQQEKQLETSDSRSMIKFRNEYFPTS